MFQTKRLKFYYPPAFYCCFLLLFFIAEKSYGQKQKIEILNAKRLNSAERNGQTARKLTGDVKLRQGDLTLNCDSAYFYTNINAVDAFGNVHIQRGDSLDIYSDSLKYDGESREVRFFENVHLRESRLNLDTRLLYYDIKNEIARYYEGGHVYNDDIDLNSKRGYYYTSSKKAFFKDSVVLISDDYTIYSDTLEYQYAIERLVFHGPSNIISEQNHIYCESGWYDTPTGKSTFGKNTVLRSEGQYLESDSLYYEQETDYGISYDRFLWKDDSLGIILNAYYAEFYRKKDEIHATDSILLIYIMDMDSLFLTSDSLETGRDSISGKQEMNAFHDVVFFKSDLQGRCDSLFFSFGDSTIRMFYDPVLWSSVNQLTGDTIAIRLKNNKVDEVDLLKNGFIISEADEEHGFYNQIKGRNIYGYFRNNELHKMLVKGNGESVYYGKDEQEAYIGINKALCSNMWIYLQNQEVSRISFLQKPDAAFTPIQKIHPDDFLLKDFIWRPDERPASKEAIYQER
ncbi:MAG: OstA-like protein [Chitinophagales bacterium]